MPITLKIKYQDDVRRISLEDLSIENVKGTIAQLFPFLNGNFTIKYIDDENDLVTLVTQSELDEAIRYSKSNLLKLEIFTSESQTSSSSSASTSTSSTTKSADIPPNPFANLANLFGATNSASSTSSSQNNNNPLAALFGPSSPLFAQQQSSTQQSSSQQSNPFANLFGQQPQQQQSSTPNTNTTGLPPFLLQLLNNPQITQSLGSSLPALLNMYQNATPQQKSMVEGFLQNPQIIQMIPQFLPMISGFLQNNNGNQNPLFANLFGQQSNPNAPQTNSHENESKPGFFCDVCENVIGGVRYHCDTCGNYDLCSFCSEIPDIHGHLLNKLQ